MPTKPKKGYEGAQAFKLREQIEKLDKQMADLEAQRGELQDELITLAASVLPNPPETPDEGVHQCTNLSGVCIYDGDADPAHDFCLFCGQPEEQK